MAHVVKVINFDGKLVADRYCSVCGVALGTRAEVKRNLFCSVEEKQPRLKDLMEEYNKS